MSRSPREGNRESYLHSNITFKSYKLLATINNLPADSTAHKNLGLCLCCIRMCVRIFSLVGFFAVMTTVLILLGSECSARHNEDFCCFFQFDVGPAEKQSCSHCLELNFSFKLGEKIVDLG